MTTAELVKDIERARDKLREDCRFSYWILTTAVNLVEREQWEDSKYLLSVARKLHEDRIGV